MEQKKPVRSPVLSGDHVTVKGLQALPDYQSVNPVYATSNLLQLQAKLTQAEQADTAATIAAVEARRAYVAASHEYHDAVVGARGQVVVQYGPDSAAVALVGLRRKSERKRPAKRKKDKDAE